MAEIAAGKPFLRRSAWLGLWGELPNAESSGCVFRRFWEWLHSLIH